VVNAQVNEAHTARLVRELERDQPTSPSTKFDMLLPSLLNYLEVQTEQQLPKFWFHLAAAKKKQEFATVRDCLEAYARGPTAFGPLAPITIVQFIHGNICRPPSRRPKNWIAAIYGHGWF
jgi:hypothetical protein